MILLSNSAQQTIPAGESLTFDTTIIKMGCSECHRENSASIRMRCNGVYRVTFSGNVTGEAADVEVQLSLRLGGETLPETQMRSTPGSASAFNNVSTTTAIKNGCVDYNRVTVTNTGTVPIIVGANSALLIEKALH